MASKQQYSELGKTRPMGQDELLLLDCLEALESRGPEAVEELLERFPDHAETVRRRMAALESSGLIDQGRVPERLGDFEVLERLGEGGMGVVYRARQESLDREVALKLIRPEHLFFEGSRKRFRREVEAVAKLSHPGIVSVYSVGEDEGIPYFAMELVRGKNLDHQLELHSDSSPGKLQGKDLDPSGSGEGYLYAGSWEDACLRIVRQVCEALDFAHQRGVLHRDIKPSNIMLTGGSNSRALLLDFGLASDAASEKITRTGSQLGSLRYMSPEQMRGKHEQIGRTSDVYSLGVSLFEMLTLTPAFSGSQVELAMQVTSKGLPLLRSRNPSSRWELETIIATACDLDPARRYPSAADLARDLANALERRPIEARRAGPLLRLRRWTQRAPAQALAAALGLILIVGGPLAYAAQQAKSSRNMLAEQRRSSEALLAEQRRSSEALLAEQARAAEQVSSERDRAVAGFEKALQAVENMLASVGADELALVPAMEGLRRKLLEDAVELLEEISDEGGEEISERSRLQLASTYKRLGRLLTALGRSAEGLPALERSRVLLEEFVQRHPEDVEALELLAATAIEETNALGDAGKMEEALALHRGLDERLEGRTGERRDLGIYAALNLSSMARLLSRMGRDEEAVRLFENSTSRLEQLITGEPVDPDILKDVATALSNYGLHFLDPGKQFEVDERAVSVLERAAELIRQVVALDDRPTNRNLSCTILNNLAGAYRRSGEEDRGRDLYLEAKGILEGLVADYPETLAFRVELATIHNQLGVQLDGLNRQEEAAGYYSEAARLLESLTVDAPLQPLYWHRFGVVQYNLSNLKTLLGEYVEADETLVRGIEAVEQAMSIAPESEEYRASLLALFTARRVNYSHAGDHAAAVETAETMIERLPDLPGSWHRAIYSVSLARAAALGDEWLSQEEREAAAQLYLERACELVRGGVARGLIYPDLRGMSNLEGIKGTPEFEELATWHDEWRAAHPEEMKRLEGR